MGDHKTRSNYTSEINWTALIEKDDFLWENQLFGCGCHKRVINPTKIQWEKTHYYFQKEKKKNSIFFQPLYEYSSAFPIHLM